MATISNTTSYATQLNPYGALQTSSMAHDFFGSQLFGSTTTPTGFTGNTTTAAVPNFMNEAATTTAGALLQMHYAANHQGQYTAQNRPQGAPTAQDYVIANQIAQQFSNNPVLISQNTSFADKDIFAQQLFPNNGVNYSC